MDGHQPRLLMRLKSEAAFAPVTMERHRRLGAFLALARMKHSTRSVCSIDAHGRTFDLEMRGTSRRVETLTITLRALSPARARRFAMYREVQSSASRLAPLRMTRCCAVHLPLVCLGLGFVMDDPCNASARWFLHTRAQHAAVERLVSHRTVRPRVACLLGCVDEIRLLDRGTDVRVILREPGIVCLEPERVWWLMSLMASLADSMSSSEAHAAATIDRGLV